MEFPIDMEGGMVYSITMKSEHPREILNWCGENEEKVLKNIDTALDKLDINHADVKKLLAEASDILQEIEELKQDAIKAL